MNAEDSQERDTIQEAIREVEACMADAPAQEDTASAAAWLFTQQNSVAVRVERLLGLAEARDILTEAAGRTWKQATDSKGQAQQFWQRLGRELTPLAQGASEALERKVDANPDDLLASVFSPKHTRREVALMAWDFCRHPLTCKADLIFPYHGAFNLLPADEALWRWIKQPHAGREAVAIPPVGDFGAALVVNRLAMVKELLCYLANLANGGRIDSATANWNHELAEQVQAARTRLWDCRDADERTGAMALLQTYLAGEAHRSGFEADWTVIPWPAEPENMSLFIVDRQEQVDRFAEGAESLWVWRNHALSRTFEIALEDHPGDVVRIIKTGLQKLNERLENKVALRAQAEAAAERIRGGLQAFDDWQNRQAAGYAHMAENLERMGRDMQDTNSIETEPAKALPESPVPNWSKPCSKTEASGQIGVSTENINTYLKAHPEAVKQLTRQKWQFDKNHSFFARLP